MKTILTLAAGFWLGRSIYLHHDKEQALKKEAAIKRRLQSLLSDYGLSKAESEEATEAAGQIIRNESK